MVENNQTGVKLTRAEKALIGQVFGYAIVHSIIEYGNRAGLIIAKTEGDITYACIEVSRGEILGTLIWPIPLNIPAGWRVVGESWEHAEYLIAPNRYAPVAATLERARLYRQWIRSIGFHLGKWWRCRPRSRRRRLVEINQAEVAAKGRS